MFHVMRSYIGTKGHETFCDWELASLQRTAYLGQLLENMPYFIHNILHCFPHETLKIHSQRPLPALYTKTVAHKHCGRHLFLESARKSPSRGCLQAASRCICRFSGKYKRKTTVLPQLTFPHSRDPKRCNPGMEGGRFPCFEIRSRPGDFTSLTITTLGQSHTFPQLSCTPTFSPPAL